MRTDGQSHSQLGGNAIHTNLVWKNILVIEERLGPAHESVDIIRSCQLGGPFILDAIFPKIFISKNDERDCGGPQIIMVSVHLGPADIIGH